MLDLRTMFAMLVLSCLLAGTGVLAMQVPEARRASAVRWGFGNLAVAAGLTLVGLRDIIPLWPSVVIGNILQFAGLALCCQSLALLAGPALAADTTTDTATQPVSAAPQQTSPRESTDADKGTAGSKAPEAGSAESSEPLHPKEVEWSFNGPVGTYDRESAQRGFLVFKQVCSACHSAKYLHFRDLRDLGFTEAEVKAIIKDGDYKVQDGPNDAGDMFERPGRVADKFPAPFPNENAARAANGGAAPPDLSLMAKARGYERGFPQFIFDAFTQFQEKGPNYIHAILTGFEEKPPAGVTLPEGSHYNKYFPGHAIKMPPPLSKDQVTYDDGSPQTVDQYATDVSAFLMWAAEPKLEERKRTGLQVMIFLLVLSGLLYFTKKKVWSDAH